MSIELVARVLNTTIEGGPTTKLVLVGLANHAGPDGKHAFPTRATLAAYAQCTPRTTTRHLTSLVQSGYIEVTAPNTRYRPTEYRIRVERLSTLPPRLDTASSSQTGHLEQLRLDTATSSRTVLEPSIEPSSSPNGHRKRDELFESLIEVSGWDLANLTPRARGKANSAAKGLRSLNPVPDGDDVRNCATALLDAYPDMIVTPHAIESNFPAYAAGRLVARRRGRR